MAADSQHLAENTQFFRVYQWEKEGVTLGHQQLCPADLELLSHAKRPTGGGVVFHCPGDLLFTVGAPLDHPLFPARLKDKMGQVAAWVSEACVAAGFDVVPGLGIGENNPKFCATYPNPYERYYKGEKVLALTLRRYRSQFLIQSILHVHSQHEVFAACPHYAPFFTKGLGCRSEQTAAIQAALIQRLEGMAEVEVDMETVPPTQVESNR